jgi:hypothetical protein
MQDGHLFGISGLSYRLWENRVDPFFGTNSRRVDKVSGTALASYNLNTWASKNMPAVDDVDTL